MSDQRGSSSHYKRSLLLHLVVSQGARPRPSCWAGFFVSPVGLRPGLQGLGTVDVQLGEPWTSCDPWTKFREGARRSAGGGVGCQGAGKPKWDKWEASRVEEELADWLEIGWEINDELSEFVIEPLGEPGPPGITKCMDFKTSDYCFWKEASEKNVQRKNKYNLWHKKVTCNFVIFRYRRVQFQNNCVKHTCRFDAVLS